MAKASKTIRLVAFAISFSASYSHAVLISKNDPIFGIDSVTLDTNTGLEWLDVNLSVSRPLTDLYGLDGSINDFTDPAGSFFGWRYAVQDEVLRFFSNAGLNAMALT